MRLSVLVQWVAVVVVCVVSGTSADRVDSRQLVETRHTLRDRLAAGVKEGAMQRSIFKKMKKKMKKGISKAGKDARDGFKHTGGQIGKGMKGFGKTLKNVAEDFGDGMMDGLEVVGDVLAELACTPPGRIASSKAVAFGVTTAICTVHGFNSVCSGGEKAAKTAAKYQPDSTAAKKLLASAKNSIYSLPQKGYEFVLQSTLGCMAYEILSPVPSSKLCPNRRLKVSMTFAKLWLDGGFPAFIDRFSKELVNMSCDGFDDTLSCSANIFNVCDEVWGLFGEFLRVILGL